MKKPLSIILLLTSIFCFSQSSERSSPLRGWSIGNVGIRYQVTDQYLPDLDYLGMIAFANSQAASEVDMSGFEAYGTHEFFSESIGAYVGVLKPFAEHFSHYIEVGADYHVASEFYVDYYNGNFFDPDYQSFGWCILQDGLNFHLRYAVSYDWKFIQARIGPTVTYGTSFNGELLLLTHDTFIDQNFGQVAATRSWVGYVDTQFAFDVYKKINVVLQGKWGTGSVGGLDERVKRSGVFGVGLEYQFR